VCASWWKYVENKEFPAGCTFHPLFIENMVGLVCANDKIDRYCTVFVGRFLREDARKSAAEVFLFANKHCAIGKKKAGPGWGTTLQEDKRNGRDNDEAGSSSMVWGTLPMKNGP